MNQVEVIYLPKYLGDTYVQRLTLKMEERIGPFIRSLEEGNSNILFLLICTINIPLIYVWIFISETLYFFYKSIKSYKKCLKCKYLTYSDVDYYSGTLVEEDLFNVEKVFSFEKFYTHVTYSREKLVECVSVLRKELYDNNMVLQCKKKSTSKLDYIYFNNPKIAGALMYLVRGIKFSSSFSSEPVEVLILLAEDTIEIIERELNEALYETEIRVILDRSN